MTASNNRMQRTSVRLAADSVRYASETLSR